MPFILTPDEKNKGGVYVPPIFQETAIVQNPPLDVLARTRNLQDSSGDNVVDDTGLVSTTSFNTGSVSKSGSETTDSTSFTDIPDMTLTVTLNRTARVLFLAGGRFGFDSFASGDTSDISLALKIGSTLYPDGTVGWGQVSRLTDSAGSDLSTYVDKKTLYHFIELAGGTHTCKLQFKKGSGSVTVSASRLEFTYIVFGV